MFLKYLVALFEETWQKILVLFSSLGVVLFFYPGLAINIAKDESLIKTIGGGIFFISFVLANYSLYKKLAQEIPNRADVRLDILSVHFGPSSASRKPFREISVNPYGYTEQGLPGWGTLQVDLRGRNVGCIDADRLIWEFEKAKAKWPPLFDFEKGIVDPGALINKVAALDSSRGFFFLDVPFAEQNPDAFAQSLRELVKSRKQYQVEIPYRVGSIHGESNTQKLRIKGDFQNFYQEILEYWEGSHTDLVRLARIA